MTANTETAPATTAVEALQQGGVIAYPTEHCFGLGCDPDNEAAVNKILAIKQRDVSKGLILIAADYSQLLPYIADDQIPQDKRFAVLSKWPGPYTLLLPAKSTTPEYLTGRFETLAVRVTDHPVARQLCRDFGKPLVSTSCNLAGEPAYIEPEDVTNAFAESLDFIVKQPCGGRDKPSTIINPLTGETYR